MLRIGLPAGGEFALMAVYIVVVYGIIRDFGAAAQAGFGVGARVMQAMFLPGRGHRFRCGAGGGAKLWGPARATASAVPIILRSGLPPS